MWTSATTGFSAQSLFPGIAYPSAEGSLASQVSLGSPIPWPYLQLSACSKDGIRTKRKEGSSYYWTLSVGSNSV